jgi:hypothetical protein
MPRTWDGALEGGIEATGGGAGTRAARQWWLLVRLTGRLVCLLTAFRLFLLLPFLKALLLLKNGIVVTCCVLHLRAM